MNVIELTNVSKTFKNHLLFQNVNVTFAKGKIYGITGANGSGKSVLFKMICLFVKPDSGTVHIHPDYLPKGRDFPQQFGILINSPGYIASLTGFENLERWASIQHKITKQDIELAMEQVGLEPNSKQKLSKYSLGMKQKIGLAQAIMEQQQVLILDEPFNALDQDSVDRISRLLETFRREGRTIVLTSHQQTDIDRLCDEVYRIERQTLVHVK
ncbi:ABC transporter ATP-binding protein [Paenibacillus campi]|uniref:ABC transporter ATP-binding protein n=1 Tax=Paenibacillus campi TaxID=3106031 RepID=UPI002B001966|nr:ABC transporter ATP-binding protein [Paenibacillus sp. SGZ-1014]